MYDIKQTRQDGRGSPRQLLLRKMEYRPQFIYNTSHSNGNGASATLLQAVYTSYIS